MIIMVCVDQDGVLWIEMGGDINVFSKGKRVAIYGAILEI